MIRSVLNSQSDRGEPRPAAQIASVCGMPASRRGSTIIVAVGVLAVLALVAVSYTVVVRNERRSALAYSTGLELETSARVVRDEIGAILTADLFGNKIVTSAVPRQGNFQGQRIRVWPRMFEDGEFFDTPQTAVGSFDTRTPDQQRFDRPSTADEWVIGPRSGIFGAFFPPAPARDDAWLSNTEPFNPGAPLPNSNQRFNWTTWGQITNLRSGYKWVKTGPTDTAGVWVRDDGRFADLGQFFLTQNARDNESGDPGANLIYSQRRNGVDEFTGVFNGPLVGLFTTQGPGGSAVPNATGVFGIQMHQMAEETTPSIGDPNLPQLTAYDRRFWVDTDGDLRPDARWTVLDSLDGLLGLRWVVAARIIDNSALINVNTAIEFQDPLDQSNVGDARTPADIDLHRLLRSAPFAPDLRTDGFWTPPPMGMDPIEKDATGRNTALYSVNPRGSANTLLHPFNQHLVTQFGLNGFTEEFHGAQARPLPTELTDAGGAQILFLPADTYLGASSPTSRTFTTRLHRYLHNRDFGVSPLQPQTRLLSGYNLADEAALRAYHAVNYDAITSRIEQRFDFGALDGAADPTIGMGPMRVLDRSATSRQFTTDPNQPEFDRPTPFAIATDTRRLLTTVNGAGDFSPVPVLNDTEVNSNAIFPQPFNTRVRFFDFPYEAPLPPAVAGASRTREQRGLHGVIERSFESFAWALAPLAGHVPLMSPLDEQAHTGWVLATRANPSRFFYGGNAQPNIGPAWALSQRNGTNGRDPGAAYAILRAASLAINLADATDFSAADPDLPTVARLYNIPHPRPYEVDPFAPTGAELYSGLAPRPQPDAVVRLGVGFSWGDLRDPSGSGADPRVPAPNANLLPTEYVGEPTHGVTLVGLDRQPFLREVSTVAVYADRLAFVQSPTAAQLSTANQSITPVVREERIGSIVAWEVGNPWPTELDMRQYRLSLAASETASITFDWGDTSTTIPAGGRVVFYVVHWDDDVLTHSEFMSLFEPQWRAEMESRIDGANLRRVTGGLEPGMLDASLMLYDEPIPFWDWPESFAVGLLTLTGDPTSLRALAGAGTLVVDRISRSAAGGVPSVLVGNYDLTPATTPGTRRTGVLTMAGSLARPTESQNPGFPAWVIERPSANVARVTAPGAIVSEWLTQLGGPQGGFGIDPPDVPAAQAQLAAEFTEFLGVEDKGAFPLSVPSFQLFVPNTELRYLSELHQLSAFTHMYVHAGTDDLGAVLGQYIAAPTQAGPGTWRTISEQLGSNAEIFRNGANDSAGFNAYLGTLDPTRFVLASINAPNTNLLGALGPIPSGPTDPSGLPESLAVPLALRVFDAFEPLATPSWRDASRLVQGRMNINTAAQKNLRMLPLVDPFLPIGPLQRQSDNDTNDVRVRHIMSYRDRASVNGSFFTPAEITGLLGNTQSPLRFASINAEPDLFSTTLGPGETFARGFVSIGELAILDEWDVSNPSNPRNPGSNAPRGFLELGADGANMNANDTIVPSLDVRRESFSDTNPNVRPTPYHGGPITAYKGVDDAEERLAIFRAVSNLVTTRSDVFTAYFTVRAYAPGDIESIEVTAGAVSDLQVSAYLDALRPTYEGRYLAVFDRSTVRIPTDRPRVLLFVRLPD